MTSEIRMLGRSRWDGWAVTLSDRSACRWMSGQHRGNMDEDLAGRRHVPSITTNTTAAPWLAEIAQARQEVEENSRRAIESLEEAKRQYQALVRKAWWS